MEIDQILKSGFDSEIETIVDRDNLSWLVLSNSWLILCK